MKLHRFSELPVGTRFQYVDLPRKTFVIVENFGRGLVVEFGPPDHEHLNWISQGIFSATCELEETKNLQVVVVDIDADFAKAKQHIKELITALTILTTINQRGLYNGAISRAEEFLAKLK